MLSSDPRIDVVSLTGSTRAGESVLLDTIAAHDGLDGFGQHFPGGLQVFVQAGRVRMQVIDVSRLNQDGRCVFGTTITLMNIDDDNEITYQIVGEDEADIALNKISCHSPIAAALMGNEEGDEVTVKAPAGDIQYEILEVQYL